MANQIEIVVTGKDRSAALTFVEVEHAAKELVSGLREVGGQALRTDAESSELAAQMRKLDLAVNAAAAANARLGGELQRVGSDELKVAAEAEVAEKATGRLGQTSRATGGHLQGLSNMLEGAVGMLKTVAIGAGTAMAAGAAAVVGFGIKSAASMQTAQVSFDLMLGSAAKAKAFLGDLQKFAVVTPFELADLQTYASRLLAVGTNAASIIPMLRHIGDATAAVGTGSFGIERAVNALNNMKLAGDVSLEHLKELAFAGVPIFDALAASLHTTTAKVLDMVSKGKIGVDQVFAAIENGTGPAFAKINGMMDKQSATLAGKWSNLKDSAAQTFGHLFEPALPALSRFVDAVGADIPKIIEKLKEFAKSDFGQRLFAALDKAGKEIIPFARKALDDLGKTIAQHKEGLIKFGNIMINDVIPALKILAEIVIGSMVGAWKGLIIVVGWVGEHFQTMKRIVVEQTRVMVDIFLGHLKRIIDGAAQAFGWIPGLGPKLRAAAAGFDRFFDEVNSKLDNLAHDRHFTITAFFKTAGSATAAQNFAIGGQARQASIMAHGGIVGAQAGGPRGGLTMVGERGYELLDLAPGTRVHSHEDSQRILAQAGDAQRPVVIEFRSGGSSFDDLLVEVIRRAVRLQGGGNVQAAFGRSGT